MLNLWPDSWPLQAGRHALDPKPLRTQIASLKHDATLAGPGDTQTRQLTDDLVRLYAAVQLGVDLREQVRLIHLSQEDVAAVERSCGR